MALGSPQWMYKSAVEDQDFGYSCRFDNDRNTYLSRAPSSSGNRRRWTVSFWWKPGRSSSTSTNFFQAGTGGTSTIGAQHDSNGHIWLQNDQGSNYLHASTLRHFRDPCAWYHIVFQLDTASSTNSDRFKLYINGTRIPVADFYHNWSSTWDIPQQNHDANWNNSAFTQYIGSSVTQTNKARGYYAEFHNIDGTIVAPSEFGETGDYGEWKPKTVSGLTYGTNGFHLDFADSSALGNDVSGNNNDWTLVNLTAADQMLDHPSNNYATMSSVVGDVLPAGGLAVGEGNLRITEFGASRQTHSTLMASSGKWYAEFHCTATMSDLQIGVANDSGLGYLGASANSWGMISGSGNKIHNGSQSSFGNSYTTNDIIMVAFDMDNGKWYVGENGSWHGSGNPAGNSGEVHDNLSGTIGFAVGSNATTGNVIANFGQDSSFIGTKTAQGNRDANGIGDFYYDPPAGYKALFTQNLPAVAVIPQDNFNTILYTGTGGGTQAQTGVGFSPDMVWVKARNITNYHGIADQVRGVDKFIYPNDPLAEQTNATDYINSFDSDGFTHGGNGTVGQNTKTYVAWNWLAGSSSSNTTGGINSTVSANTDAGFSIVSYTGTGSASSVGHGLSKAPEMIIVKNLGATDSFTVWHPNLTSIGYHLTLDNDAAEQSGTGVWNDTFPTSSLFYVKTDHKVNESTNNYIAYCWHSVDGYSKVGTYIGNGKAADGTFVYTGFRPAWIMIKHRTTSNGRWMMFDNKRQGYNNNNDELFADLADVEVTSNNRLDFLSNGIKLYSSGSYVNTDGDDYLYLAFAETPFKYSNSR